MSSLRCAVAEESWVVNRIEGGIFLSSVIQGRDITIRLPPEPATAMAGLPPAVRGFVGRTDELADAVAALTAATGDAVVVTGMAGVGKTELALQAAEEVLAAGHFPGGVLFTRMHDRDPAAEPAGSDRVARSQDEFLRALGVAEAVLPAAGADRELLYRSVLSGYAKAERRVLIVVDNATGDDALARLLPGPPHAAIVTSRETLGMVGARLIELDVLAEGDGVALMRHAVERAHGPDPRFDDDPDAVGEIVRLCGNLPQALRIVGALLVDDRARPLALLAADLADGRQRLDELRYGAEAVRSAFVLSHSRLEERDARMFALLGAFPGAELPSEAAVALADLDYDSARRSLERLVRVHLIEHGTAYGRWRLHDLLRLFAEELLDSRESADGRDAAFARVFSGYRGSVAAIALIIAYKAEPDEYGFASRADAIEWLGAEYDNVVALLNDAAAREASAEICDFVDDLGGYVHLRHRYAEWLALTGLAREAARALGDRAREAWALISHGIALLEAGRLAEAAAAQATAAEAFRDLGDQIGEGRALGNLANALTASDRASEAVAQAEAAIALLEREGDTDGTGTAWSVLGDALVSLERPQEALAAYRRSLTIGSDTGTRELIVLGLSGVALTSAELDGLEETIHAARAAADLAREIGDRHALARMLLVLGEAFMRTEHPEKAIERFREALDFAEDLHLPDDLVADIDLRLASALGRAGRRLEAIDVAKRAVARYRALERTDGLREALALLAKMSDAQEWPRQVAALWREAYALWTEADDQDARRSVLAGLGRSLVPDKAPGLAVLVDEDAIPILEEAAQSHRDAGDELGFALAQGFVATAWEHTIEFRAGLNGVVEDADIQKMLAARRAEADAYSLAHAAAQEATARLELGLSLDKIDASAAALTEFDSAATLFERAGDGAGLAEAANRKGIALRHSGRLLASVDAHLTALEAYRSLGAELGQANAHANLGNAYAALGHLRAARDHFSLAIDAFERLGDEDYAMQAHYRLRVLRNPLRTLVPRFRRLRNALRRVAPPALDTPSAVPRVTPLGRREREARAMAAAFSASFSARPQ